MPEFFDALHTLGGKRNAALRQANLADTIVRKCFSFDIKEFAFHLCALAGNGGFVRAEDFNYVMTTIKRYVAGYEYDKQFPFQTPLEIASYTAVITFYISEFTSKFANDQKAAAYAGDIFNRSFDFWCENLDKFDASQTVFLAQGIGQLGSAVKSTKLPEFASKLQPKVADLASSTLYGNLQALLKVNEFFRVLSPKQLENVSQKISEFKNEDAKAQPFYNVVAMQKHNRREFLAGAAGTPRIPSPEMTPEEKEFYDKRPKSLAINPDVPKQASISGSTTIFKPIRSHD